MKVFLLKPLLLLLALVVVLQHTSFAQSCPSLPGGYYTGALSGSTHEYLYPGVVPSGSPSGSVGAKTIGYFNFPGRNTSFANRKMVTVSPTLNGSNYGKVIFNIWRLSFGTGTVLRIYSGTGESGTLIDEINTANYASKVGSEYVIDGSATLVFYGITPSVSNNNIIRFLTGDIPIETCNAGRTGLVWKDFITPDSYVIVDDQEYELNNLSTSGYNFLPACMAYFDENRSFVRVETSFCLDLPKESPSPGYWHYPGQYRFSLNSVTDYDIDRDGFNASIDNLKIARIIWLIQQAAGVSSLEKGNIQLAIWSTQSNAINHVFTANSWADRAQDEVPSIPSPAEPDFALNLSSGETGTAVAGSGTIKIDIPFSWSPVQPGQTNVVKLVIPSGVKIESVTGGALSGVNLTITAAVATLTLSSSSEGKYDIKAVYDNPQYYNVNNLNVYRPCNGTPQEFLHLGDENLSSPFRSISVQWTATPLPVRLVKFDAVLENSVALLRWNTAEEVNFSHFEVEKSQDAKQWRPVSKVNGNASGIYQFEDADLLAPGMVYYRLKLVDNDGTYAYSPIKSIVTENGKRIAMYPNPASSVLTISKPDAVNIDNVKIYDQFGLLKLNAGSLVQNTIDVGSFSNGVYIVNFLLKNGTLLTQKLIVNK